MAFQINGETWQPQTATEHTIQIIEKINQLLQEEGITDKDGNIVQLKNNYGNALYLLAMGDGARFAENDAKLSRAINSFNVELCDDMQLQNLLPIAAMTRNPGSYSTIILTVKATEDGTCIIPAGTRAPFGDYFFVTKTEAVISAGQTQNIEAVCDTIGPIVALAHEVNSFESTIAGLESVDNESSSLPGVAPETINELRQRIIKGDTIRYSLDGCKNALEEQTGIAYARVYFNYNTTESITLPGGVVLQPRHAYIVIQGESDKIAEIYTSYQSAETQNDTRATPYTTVNVTVEAGDSGVTIPANTEITYNGNVFKNNIQKTISAGQSESITFTSISTGSFLVPANIIEEFDTPIEGATIIGNQASVPSTIHSQIFTTESGQEIEIKYDTATNMEVYIKVVVGEETDVTNQLKNQIKRDLIKSSASWTIGEHVTSLLASAPFIECQYARIAYTQVSLDGNNWLNHIVAGCNVIPTLTDANITVISINEEN